MDGWMGGWEGGRVDVKAVLRIAYSNQKLILKVGGIRWPLFYGYYLSSAKDQHD